MLERTDGFPQVNLCHLWVALALGMLAEDSQIASQNHTKKKFAVNASIACPMESFFTPARSRSWQQIGASSKHATLVPYCT